MSNNIALFASGKGTNAEKICTFFRKSKDVRVNLICANNKESQVFNLAKSLEISSYFIDNFSNENSQKLYKFLLDKKIDYIVLAGFLLKSPSFIINFFPNKIINLHPSLLPKYGGKGMYGARVHKEVIRNNEKESGITIHYVNENYDEGAVIYQHKYRISLGETDITLSKKIQKLEHSYYPLIIEKLIKKNL
jgi:phosphoribosylglycinamide formyltransferase-1